MRAESEMGEMALKMEEGVNSLCAAELHEHVLADLLLAAH